MKTRHLLGAMLLLSALPASLLLLVPESPSAPLSLTAPERSAPRAIAPELAALHRSADRHGAFTSEQRGTRAALRFDLNQQVALSDRHGPASKLVVTVRGTLQITPLGRRGDEIISELRFEGLKVELHSTDSATQALPALTTELAAAPMVFSTGAGWPVGYRFADGHGPIARNLVRTLISALAFPQPTEDVPLELTGADAAGTFHAVLRYADHVGNERRVTKDTFLGSSATQPDSRAPRGSGVAWFAAGRSHWLRAEHREHLRSEVDLAGAKFESELHVVAELVEEGAVHLREQPELFEGRRDPLAGDSEHDSEGAAALARAEADSVRDLHALPLAFELAELVQNGQRRSERFHAAWRKLCLVAARDGAPDAQLRALIESGAFPPGAIESVLSALGSHGDLETQRWLSGLARGERFAPATRASALRSLFQGEAHPAEIRASVRELALSGTSTSGEVARTALLLLGRYAIERDAEGEAAWSALRSNAAAWTALGMETTWIHAIENAGREEGRELLAPLLASTRPGVRRAAATALRGIETRLAGRG